MKKSVLAFLSSVLALVIVSTTMTAPAQAVADGNYACSTGGTFTVANGGTRITTTSGCSGVTTIPASVTAFDTMAFMFKGGMTEVIFEAGSTVTHLQNELFRSTGISRIVLPSTLQSIGDLVFSFTSLTSLTLPGGVNAIGVNTLPESLETLIFEPRTATTLSIGNLRDNSKIKSITFQGPGTINSLPSVKRTGFNYGGWSSSEGGPAVTFPYTFTAANGGTLYPILVAKVIEQFSCSGGGKFEIHDGVLQRSSCSGEITIPAKVTSIPDQAFYNQPITKINFEANSQLEWIGAEAFRQSQITSITFPSSLRSIHRSAFAYSSIRHMTIPGTVEYLGEDFAPLSTIVFETRIAANLSIHQWAFSGARANLESITFNTPYALNSDFQGTRPVFNYLGWSDTLDGPVRANPGTVSGTVYTRWSPKTFTATYNSNGGTPVASGSIVGGAIQFPTPPTRAGYTFAGWFENAAGSGAQVTSWKTESNPTFYAKWVINKIVNFDSQGGSAVSAGDWPQGGQISQAPVDPTRPGYTFAGWSRTVSGAALTFPYSPGGTVDITLFAKWTANTNAVNFNSMGGSAVPAGSFVTDAAISSAPEAPTRPGYTFNGWSATEGGEAVTFPYSPAATSDITLFAKWTANTYLVNLSTNGGSSVAPGSFQTDGPIASALTEPLRPGYTFVAWSATDGGDALTFPYSPGVIGNITLYAIWDANTYSVTLDTKGGLPVLAVSFRTDGNIALAPTTPIRPGYTFLGWSATNGGDAVSFPYAPGVIEGITLFAKWDANTYAVTLNTTGGLALPEGSFRTDGDIPLAPPTPVRVGYTFVGWALTNGGTALSFPYAPGVIENITLFANWTRDPFKPELISGDVIAGTGIQSTLLSAAGGSWLAYPEAVVSHQWYRCSASVAAGLSALPTASKCVKITGATAANYKVAVPDAGKYLTALVQAKNTIGTTFLTVASFRAPSLKAPTKLALPVGTGTAKASSYLSGTVGTWVGNPVPKTTVQWFRCENATAASAKAVPGSGRCEAIRGATSTRYRLGTADKGKYVTLQITAKNSEGTAISTAKSQRVLLDPNMVNPPVVTGSAALNRSLRVNTGTWLAYPSAKTSIQWYRCNRATSAGAKSFSGSSGCKAISGATRSSYTITAADTGKYVSALVKAVNTAGTKSATARSTDKIE
jgi:uncharacterized repeat protein (TIGR02543 family)